MKVKTNRFGEIEIGEDALINFPEGIIGFHEAKRFVILECTEDGFFKWLQSCDQPELAFVICEARLIRPDYRIMISDKEREILGLQRPEDAAVCVILQIPADPQEATANLLGPIVMNAETRIGMQLVLINPEYSTRYPLFQREGAAADKEEGACSS